MSEFARYRVLVRPQGAGPLWWPHVIDWDERMGKVVRFRWAATDGASYSAVINGGETFEADGIGEVLDSWWEEHDEDPWPWEFRIVVVAE